MIRHLWRAAGGSAMLVVCLMSLPHQAFGQGIGTSGLGSGAGIFNDPFAFYYAIYLPNQQLQSMRPSPMDSINSAMVTRQYYAQNTRQNLYNPISPYSDQNFDPLHPYSRQQGSERLARPYRFAADPSNSDGSGPALYYGRASAYFPRMREGRGRNANIYSRGGASRPGWHGRRHGWRNGRHGWRNGRRHGRHGWHDVSHPRAPRFDRSPTRPRQTGTLMCRAGQTSSGSHRTNEPTWLLTLTGNCPKLMPVRSQPN